MSHYGHEIVKCSLCGNIIRQCRCMAQDKAVVYEVCGDCAKVVCAMKTMDEIIYEQVGIGVGSDGLTPMDKCECKRCMKAYLEEYKKIKLGDAKG